MVVLFTLVCCEQEAELTPSENIAYKNQVDFLSLGKKLENPYSVKNMKQALENLKQKGLFKTSNYANRIEEEFNIIPTHYYVEFEPQTLEDEALLKQDSTRVLFDYPLDYEFSDEVLDNRPALEEHEVSNYYAAIRIDSEEASDAHYQLLEELYIPEEDNYFDTAVAVKSSTSKNTIENKQDLLRHLLYEAYKLTGNEAELEQPTENGRLIFGTRWWPSGNVSVYDEVAGANKPVVGAQVLIRQWFTVRQGITDANGNFSTSSVRGSARYILQWERYHYSIRNGSFFQAETRGPKETNVPWNTTITEGDDKYHALIHQAAHDYYYSYRFGLTSPPRNGFDFLGSGPKQMKIAARETAPWGVPSSYSHLRGEVFLGLFAEIHIKAWGRSSDRVYGTTIHEIAHAAHWVVDSGSYDNLVRDFLFGNTSVQNRNRRLLETWPTTVEIVMTLERYKTKFGNPNYEYGNTDGFFYRNYQNQTILEENHYTSAGYDMIDIENQRNTYNNLYPIDRVSGYTIKQLEGALIGAKHWDEWRDNIKNRYDNPTEQYLDELFNNWSN